MAEDKKDVPYDAPWVVNLTHRPDPNRVGSIQMHPTGAPIAPISAPPTFTRHVSREAPEMKSSSSMQAKPHDPQATAEEASYYNISPLKPPVWKWQIASYFFLGGLASGAYVLGRMADRFGGPRYRRVTRVSAYVSMATIAACPPLLIWDLGDPMRFHHMMRIWKPGSPMNLGAWAILGFSGVAALEALRQVRHEFAKPSGATAVGKLLDGLDNRAFLLLRDLAGVPLAIIVAGYTGVLLTCTSNPLWCKNPYLGALFSASALSTGAEALSLTLDLTGASNGKDQSAQKTLMRTDTAAHLSELALEKRFSKFAGEKAKPLRSGPSSKYYKFAVTAIVGAEMIKRLPVAKRYQRAQRIVANLLGLTGGLTLRWGIVMAGHDAANNPHIARLVSQPRTRPGELATPG